MTKQRKQQLANLADTVSLALLLGSVALLLCYGFANSVATLSFACEQVLTAASFGLAALGAVLWPLNAAFLHD